MNRQFKLLVGQHHHREGTMRQPLVYKAGEIVETSMDLVKKFGTGKFQEVFGPVAAAPAVATPEPAAPQPAAAESATATKETGTASKPDDAEDVTELFPKAAIARFLVVKKAGGYWVADADNPGKFANKRALKKAEVEDYVADLAK
jgi:hypothetical protein